MLHTPPPRHAPHPSGPRSAKGRQPAPPVTAAAHRAWQRGVKAADAGQWAEAEKAFAAAAAAAPRDVLPWLNLARARQRLDDLPGATDAVMQALAAEPGHALARRYAPELWARLIMQRGAAAPQLAGLPEPIRRDPALMAAVGRWLWEARRTVDAVSVLMAAAVLAPARVETHELLMFCMRDLGLKSEAAECAKTVLALEPGRLVVRMHKLFDQRGACDWSDVGELPEIVEDILGLPDDAAKPLPVFGLLSLCVDPVVIRKAAAVAARAHAAGASPLAARSPAQRPAGPLRLGFLSSDFNSHPVAQLITETLERLDRTRCRVHLYAVGADDRSDWRQRLEATADRFLDCAGQDDATVARHIHGDAIDVLIELGGHTRGARLGVLAWRPAPVQASYLGYPGTTGAPGVDYLIGDAIVTPVEHAAHYSEKIAQLAGCQLPASRHRPLPGPMSRAQADLPDDAFVMCAFNQPYKLLPQTFAIWCAVMREVPNAVLWLKAPNEDVMANLRREAQARGVAPERLVFTINKIAFEDHFSRLALADVFVDNWPYNAHTTASDALWAGLPVLTMCGGSFPARVAASLLTQAGLTDFVCDSPEQYQQRLLALAREPALLRAARERLVAGRDSSSLFDSTRHAADLLHLVERMHQRHRQGLAPDHLPAVAVAPVAAAATAPLEPVAPAAPVAPVAPATAAPTPSAAATRAPALRIDAPIRLHVGGKQAKPGWKILNIQPGPAVDFVGDVGDLSAFPDACCEAIYASHVLEHVSQQRMPATLAGLARLLAPGGQLMVSVPDLEVLSHTIITPHASLKQKFHAMRMMFGGQVDPHDFHCFGWTFDFMRHFLADAGFSSVERVASFGLFDDTSNLAPWGFPISLNVIATR